VRNLPNTYLGIAWGNANLVAGKLMGKNTYVKFGNNAIQYMNAPFEVSGRAVTLGNVTVYPTDQKPSDTLQKSYSASNVNVGYHEEGHTHQGEMLGGAYLLAEAASFWRGNNNPLERGADKYEQGMSCSGL
jgi:hypothetical protein